MNRSQYFGYIEERLCTLATRINTKGKLNLLDLHVMSENFYRDFFNILFSLELENLNAFKQNAEAIDLIDKTNKIIIQVSSINTKVKIESSLSKDLSGYAGFDFKFISIAKDAANLRNKTFTNPHNLNFLPKNDIFDISLILKEILNFNTDRQKEIYAFIKQRVGSRA